MEKDKLEKVKQRFSMKIYDLRIEKRFSQEKMAEFLNISPRCLQKWESGKSLPDFVHTLILVHFLKFNIFAFAAEIFS